MKLITKNTDYAIRALIYLAQHSEGYVSSREISREEEIPLSYLRRLLQVLSKEEFIITREGVTGGVKLATDPAGIKLTRLIRIFQGDVRLMECIFRKQLCSNRADCVLRKRMKDIEDKMINELEDITIGSLVDDLSCSHEGSPGHDIRR